jgi:hypothetical protein
MYGGEYEDLKFDLAQMWQIIMFFNSLLPPFYKFFVPSVQKLWKGWPGGVGAWG